MNLYVYRLKEVVRIVDGDTYDLILDVGFHQQQASRFRLADYDTPEIFWNRATELEKSKGQEAIKAVTDWLITKQFEEKVTVYAKTSEADSFGRWLVDLFTEDSHLGEELAAQGLATEWPTRWRDVYITETSE